MGAINSYLDLTLLQNWCNAPTLAWPYHADISMAKLKYLCKKGAEVKKFSKKYNSKKIMWQKKDSNPMP